MGTWEQGGPKEFRVTWEITVYADSAETAARQALETIKRPGSQAHVFQVRHPEHVQQWVTIDLNYPDEDEEESATVTVPRDFPVQPFTSGDFAATDPMWCGTCGRWWDDAIVTEYTPVPSGRCPFEAYH